MLIYCGLDVNALSSVQPLLEEHQGHGERGLYLCWAGRHPYGALPVAVHLIPIPWPWCGFNSLGSTAPRVCRLPSGFSSRLVMDPICKKSWYSTSQPSTPVAVGDLQRRMFHHTREQPTVMIAGVQFLKTTAMLHFQIDAKDTLSDVLL
jgi:hypothetical protein